MLFEFNKFWKILAILASSWIVYGIWGYELTMVTLVALMLNKQMHDNDNIDNG